MDTPSPGNSMGRSPDSQPLLPREPSSRATANAGISRSCASGPDSAGNGHDGHGRQQDIAIFNVDGNVHAIGDTCVHAGASLGSGKLNGRIVTCPAHGLRYDVTTGEVTTGGLRVDSYPVKIVDGRILIAVEQVTESSMPSARDRKIDATADSFAETGPWDDALATLCEWDPAWAETCTAMTTNPWSSGVLPRKTVELISLALNAACTNLNPEGTRHHIRAALEAGANHEEILMVLKMASLLAIHSCSLGAPILLEEAKAAGAKPPSRPAAATPACDKVRAMGQWNDAWNPFVELDPVWTDQFMATGIGIYGSGLMPPKLVEFLSIALDASYTHMYGPGTQRHIKAALKLGATVERDHGSAQAVRSPGRSGVQSGSANSRR
jgi:nitrite reductase/ring-hydroxylating ferredoxin subunit/alkylhydroperoxidase/carboxymuconolactone decarboxylase family protein YurZ